jgi:HAD superfamily hydrolase (TIGR01509 family)
MTRPYPFGAALFDMDGVVLDDIPLHHALWREFTGRYGIVLDDGQVRWTNGRRAADVIAAFFRTSDSARIAALLGEREQLYETHLREDELHPVAGLRDFLSGLNRAGVPCVLGTSGVPAAAEIILSRLGIADRFTARITAADVTHGKPDPEVWQKAAAAAGVPVGNCLVIEDAVPGIQAAKAAGARCLGIATSFTPAQLLADGADWAAADFTQLPPLLLPHA